MAENTGPAEMLIAYDPVLKRPGCALIAAAYGADYRLCHRFESRDWLQAPTPNMGLFRVTAEQLDQLVKITEANR